MIERRLGIITIVMLVMYLSLGLVLLIIDRDTPPCREIGLNPVEFTALTNMLLRENNLMKETK